MACVCVVIAELRVEVGAQQGAQRGQRAAQDQMRGLTRSWTEAWARPPQQITSAGSAAPSTSRRCGATVTRAPRPSTSRPGLGFT